MFLLNNLKQNGIVKIIKLNFSDDIKLKFENIGVYPGQLIKVHNDYSKNIIIFEINKIKYGIRKNEAKNILVKKVNNDVCLFV